MSVWTLIFHSRLTKKSIHSTILLRLFYTKLKWNGIEYGKRGLREGHMDKKSWQTSPKLNVGMDTYEVFWKTTSDDSIYCNNARMKRLHNYNNITSGEPLSLAPHRKVPDNPHLRKRRLRSPESHPATSATEALTWRFSLRFRLAAILASSAASMARASSARASSLVWGP